MAPARKQPRRVHDPLEPYRRIRKPMPPPERVIRDHRRRDEDRRAEREAREVDTGQGGSGG
jgi:hypothetical protein